MNLNFIDLVVIVVYFIATLALGFYVSRRSTRTKNTDDYFLGGRSFPGWAIGISFIGAMVSSVTFIALPADSFKTAWVRFLPNLGFPLAVLISAYVFIPFFRRGTITSAYQYLEKRFGRSVSLYCAMVFLLAQIIRTAMVVYLVALLMATLTGFRLEWCLLAAGGTTAVYTIKGGFTAVVWTDVVQTVILVTGAVAAVICIILAIPGGLSEIWSMASAAGKFSIADLDAQTNQLVPVGMGFSLSEKTASMLMLVGFMQYLSGKLNQESVQRWCSASSAREARKSMVVLGTCSLPIWACFMFIGTCLWVYYQHFPDAVSMGILAGERKAEEIFPHFITTAMPVGLSGLLIAAALAAAMSTLSSAINSASMVVVHDIYGYFIPGKSSRHYFRVGLASSFGVSLLMIVGAYLFHIANTKTLTDFNIIVTTLLGGGTAGAFLLGMLTRRGDARAVFVGVGAALLFTIYAILAEFGYLPKAIDTYYSAIIANLIVFVVGYGAAFLLPTPTRDLTELTVWDQPKTPPVAVHV